MNLREIIDAEPATVVVAQPASGVTIDLAEMQETRERVGVISFDIPEDDDRHALALPMTEIRRLYHDLGALLEGERPTL